MVTGSNLGGSGTDLAANMSLIHNLLSQKTEALHLLLVNQHFLLPALVIHVQYNKITTNSLFLVSMNSIFYSMNSFYA